VTVTEDRRPLWERLTRWSAKPEALPYLDDRVRRQVALGDAAKELERVLVLDALGNHERPAGARMSPSPSAPPNIRLGRGGDHDARVELAELRVDLAEHVKAAATCSDIVDLS
jgi:hypothetical protein